MRDEVRHRRNWTPAETQELIRMCNKGYEIETICQELGRNENAIRAKASRAGFSIKGGEFNKKPNTVSKNSKVVGTYTIKKKPWWKRLIGGR